MALEPQPINYYLVSKNDPLTRILTFFIETKYNSNVDHCKTAEEALNFLRQVDRFPQFVIYDYEPESYLLEDFIDLIRKLDKEIYLIVLNDKIAKDGANQRTQMKHLYVSHQEEILIKVDEITQKLFHFLSPSNTSEYKRISYETLLMLNGLQNDLYLELPSGKYIKLFHGDDNLDHDDIKRYADRGVKEFYLTNETGGWVIEQIAKQFNLLLKNKNYKFILCSPDSSEEKKFEQKVIRVRDEIHLDPELKEQLTKVMDKVLKILQSNPQIGKLLRKIKAQKDKSTYFSRKAKLLSFVSSFLAKELEWHSQVTLEKLVYASYLHDITIATKPHLMKIRSFREFNEMELSEEDRILYQWHPKEAAGIIKTSFSSAPFESEALILQHHELPNGSGFPEKLNAGKIPPLSALFIVAHDFTQYLLTDQPHSVDEYLLGAQRKFESSSYIKYLDKIRKIPL